MLAKQGARLQYDDLDGLTDQLFFTITVDISDSSINCLLSIAGDVYM